MPAARRLSTFGQQNAQSVCTTVQGRRSKMARVRGKSSLLRHIIVPNIGQYLGLCDCLLQYYR